MLEEINKPALAPSAPDVAVPSEPKPKLIKLFGIGSNVGGGQSPTYSSAIKFYTCPPGKEALVEVVGIGHGSNTSGVYMMMMLFDPAISQSDYMGSYWMGNKHNNGLGAQMPQVDSPVMPNGEPAYMQGASVYKRFFRMMPGQFLGYSSYSGITNGFIMLKVTESEISA